MTEGKRQKILEALEKEIDTHIRIVDEVMAIFSKIKTNPSSIEEFKDILTKVSHLKGLRASRKFDKSDLDRIAGKLLNLRTALGGIRENKR